MKKIILPSIIAKDKDEFTNVINKVKDHATHIHLDIMDKRFVSNESLNFNLNQLYLKKTYPNHNISAHIMVNDPKTWIKTNINHVDHISFHIEATKVTGATNEAKALIKYIKNKNKSVGIAINPNTSLEELENKVGDLNQLDKLVVMTVIPGQYGAKFQKDTLKKITRIRKKYPNLNIQADGSMNNKTIERTAKAGANMFVVGSFLQKSNNIKEDIRKLRDLIK